MPQDKVPTIAVIGCGAIAEAFHLPALTQHRDVLKHLILVDVDSSRAHEVARRFGVGRTATDYREILPEVDGVVITLPHRMHYDVTMECTDRKIHVLCEKPLCSTGEEVRNIVSSAERSGTHVIVNNTRRLYPSSAKVRQLLREGFIGELQELEFHEGDVFGWPAATGAHFGLQSGGRGVLQDRGSHALDLVCWWLGGKPEVTWYRDDSLGGSEAVAHLALRFGTCTGMVKLSWLSRLRNEFRIVGSEGELRGKVFDWRVFYHQRGSGTPRTVRAGRRPATAAAFAHMLIDNFLEVIAGRAEPLIQARDVADSIELIDECYRRRTPFEMPWYRQQEQVQHAS